MLFSSIFFLSIFLPAVVGIYYLVKPDKRNFILLLASLLFYAWGDFQYLGMMIGVIFLNYSGAILLDKFSNAREWFRKLLMAVFVVGDLSVLFFFKYFSFFTVNINNFTALELPIFHVIMPLGISFYTFQGISYLVDVYRREIPVQKNLYTLALFITFFPQLIAGPILKYHDVYKEMIARKETFSHFVYGLQRFIIGLAKKVIIANTLGSAADTIFSKAPESMDGLTVWGGALAYTLQLYFDFSGYSDMAIGLGAMFGFHFLENFNYPYISKSITEFWRRWHISLSTWFREYLYIPLGGNRVGKVRLYINLFIVFLATGFWHGAEWSFIVWGLFHGFFIIMEKLTKWNEPGETLFIRCAQHCYLLLLAVVGWVFFRAADLPYAFQFLGRMFGCVKAEFIPVPAESYFPLWTCFILVLAAVLSTGVARNILSWGENNALLRFCRYCYILLLLFLSIMFLAGNTYNPFIYFRF